MNPLFRPWWASVLLIIAGLGLAPVQAAPTSQRFMLRVGTTVTNGVPANGAGLL